MISFPRLVFGVALGAAAIIASAMALAVPASAQWPGQRHIQPTYPHPAPAPAPRVYPRAPAYQQPRVYPRAYQQPRYVAPAPRYVAPAPRYAPAPVYRPRYYNPPVYRQPAPVYRAYPVAPVYPAAPVWQDWPGQAAYGCVWRKRKVWSGFGFRTKWRQVCY